MNRKKTKLGKILPKLLLLLTLVAVLVISMSSCGNSTAINKNTGLEYWAGTTGTETEVSETTGAVESDTTESNAAESDTAESGAAESDTAETGTTETDTKETETAASGGNEENTDDKGGKKDVILEYKPGFIDYILIYIGKFLNLITRIMPWNSYILTLFVFAILFEFIMLPFSIKQQKNSIKQAKLKPKEMAIRRKYAGRNDQVTMQKVNQEIQELYQKENFNPMGGCLPLLIQFPIIIILYSLVIDPVKFVYNGSSEFINFMHHYLNSVGEGLTVTNGSVEVLSKISEIASRPDGMQVFEGIKDVCGNGEAVIAKIEEIAEFAPNFNIGSLNLGLTPSFNPANKLYLLLLLVPVLTFVVQYFTMKLTRKFTFQPGQEGVDRQTACSNKMMDLMMPLMSVWIAFVVPAVVGVYWIFKGIIGTVKQYIMSKVMPLPQFTEEDYKAAEREMYGKQPKKIQKSANAGHVRSLHHIDDEDYDENGNYVPQPERTEEETEKKPQDNKLPENKMTEGASLKDDSDKEKREKRTLFGNKKDDE